MEMIVDKIIDYIMINRVSTTEVADCMNKSGVLKDVYALKEGHFVVGKVKYVYGFNESNYSIHEQIQEIAPDSIIIIDGFNVNDRALIGELVTKYLILYKRARAVVVLGNIRDVNGIIRHNYPVWIKGKSPVGCFNSIQNMDLELKEKIEIEKQKYQDCICVCDDTGVVLISKEFHTEEFLVKLHNIEEQEDVWFYCIDNRKMNTFDVVCNKKYLDSDLFDNNNKHL